MKYRVMRAKELLRNVNLSVAYMASVCGFAHHSHFTRVFTAMTGCSPGKWRRILQEPRAIGACLRSYLFVIPPRRKPPSRQSGAVFITGGRHPGAVTAPPGGPEVAQDELPVSGGCLT